MFQVSQSLIVLYQECAECRSNLAKSSGNADKIVIPRTSCALFYTRRIALCKVAATAMPLRSFLSAVFILFTFDPICLATYAFIFYTCICCSIRWFFNLSKFTCANLKLIFDTHFAHVFGLLSRVYLLASTITAAHELWDKSASGLPQRFHLFSFYFSNKAHDTCFLSWSWAKVRFDQSWFECQGIATLLFVLAASDPAWKKISCTADACITRLAILMTFKNRSLNIRFHLVIKFFKFEASLIYVKSLMFVYQHIFHKNKSWNNHLTLNDDIWSRLRHVSEIFITSLHVHCFQKSFRETVYTISRSEKTREFVSNEFCNSTTRKIATLEVKVVNVGINVGW